MNILIVDDSPSICMVLTYALEADSHTVITYPTGEEAVAGYLTKQPPDLIIMDVELPGIDGFEATRQIRASETDNWCPIVFLSSHTEETLIERGIDAGGDSYLTKPIKLIELTSMMKAFERIANVRKKLTRANETLNSILNTATDGIYIIDSNGYILSVNQSACTMFEIDEDEAIGAHISSVSADMETLSSPEAFKLHIDQVIHKQLGVRRDVEFRSKSDKIFTAEISTSFVDDEEGGIYIGIFHDISRRKAYESELKKSRKKLRAMNEKLLALSYRDGLTGIHNRRSFDELILKEFQQAQRDQTEISLIMCDIDHFKAYNDTYGHQLGDDTLITAARTIENSLLRPSDLAARYGGEEFVILLPQTGASGARIVAENTRSAVANLAIPHSSSPPHQYLTISLGTSTIRPTNKHSIENLIQMADQALYSAKEMGRNNVQSHDAPN